MQTALSRVSTWLAKSFYNNNHYATGRVKIVSCQLAIVFEVDFALWTHVSKSKE